MKDWILLSHQELMVVEDALQSKGLEKGTDFLVEKKERTASGRYQVELILKTRRDDIDMTHWGLLEYLGRCVICNSRVKLSGFDDIRIRPEGVRCFDHRDV